MNAERAGPDSRPAHPIILHDDQAHGITDLQARLATAGRVATRWLTGEPVTDAELEALILLLARCETDAERLEP